MTIFRMRSGSSGPFRFLPSTRSLLCIPAVARNQNPEEPYNPTVFDSGNRRTQ